MYIDWDAIEADYLIYEAKKAYERGDITTAFVLSHKASVKRQESLAKAYKNMHEALQDYKKGKS